MHTKAYNLISQVQNRFLQVKGISLNERTFIDKAKFRKILRSVLSKSISVESIKKTLDKLYPLSTCEDGESAILRLLEYVSNLEVKTVPNCYAKLIDEISKNTPIVGLIQTQSRSFTASLRCYLEEEVDIFAERDILENLNEECPVIVNIITEIKSHEKKMFMPKEVVDILNVVLDKHEMISKLAEKRKGETDKFTGTEPPTDCYPSLPLHTSKKTIYN